MAQEDKSRYDREKREQWIQWDKGVTARKEEEEHCATEPPSPLSFPPVGGPFYGANIPVLHMNHSLTRPEMQFYSAQAPLVSNPSVFYAPPYPASAHARFHFSTSNVIFQHAFPNPNPFASVTPRRVSLSEASELSSQDSESGFKRFRRSPPESKNSS
jgi:hypothetical protein